MQLDIFRYGSWREQTHLLYRCFWSDAEDRQSFARGGSEVQLSFARLSGQLGVREARSVETAE